MATPALPAVPSATTIDEVIVAIQSVVDWSIEARSRLGYFAALYKRITVAVAAAIAQGAFDDGPRIERLDVTFANRYFDALNAHLHRGRFPPPTRCWQVTFTAAARPEPIIVQHMLAGVNAHIGLDLGIAAATVAPGPALPTLLPDFNTVNAVLASQVSGILDQLDELSPALAELYEVLQHNEVFLINQAVKVMRDSAWRFASLLALEPAAARPATIWVRDRRVASQSTQIYDPPQLVGLVAGLIEAIAERESRDIAANIAELDRISSTPAPIATTL
jgi:uncharacterized protein DUF5995